MKCLIWYILYIFLQFRLVIYYRQILSDFHTLMQISVFIGRINFLKLKNQSLPFFFFKYFVKQHTFDIAPMWWTIL